MLHNLSLWIQMSVGNDVLGVGSNSKRVPPLFPYSAALPFEPRRPQMPTIINVSETGAIIIKNPFFFLLTLPLMPITFPLFIHRLDCPPRRFLDRTRSTADTVSANQPTVGSVRVVTG